LKLQNSIISKLRFYFKSLIEKYYFPYFENIIFISSYNKNKFPQRRLDKIFSTIIPNSIDISKKKSENFKRKLVNKIIYVGAINKRKNLLLLLKALSNLKKRGIELSLTIAGGSKEKKYLKKIFSFIHNNNLRQNINLLGWISNSEVRNLLYHHDFMILPSSQETLPVSIIESLSMGTPVIATNVGGIPEMIENGKNGFLFEPNNLGQLENLLKKIYSNMSNVQYQSLSESALETVYKKYCSKLVAKKHIEFYNQIIKKNKNISVE